MNKDIIRVREGKARRGKVWGFSSAGTWGCETFSQGC